MKKECPICHDNINIILLEDRLNLYKCNYCLHTFSLIPKEKQETYDKDYFEKTHKNWMTNPDYRLFDFIYDKTVEIIGNEKIRLLDVGCGNGDFLKYIAKKNLSLKLTGIDLVDNQHPNINFIKGDFLENKIETKFNVICGLEVVEHIENPNLFIQKIHNLLEPRGFLLLTTINSNSLLYRIARLLNAVGTKTAFNRIYSKHHLQHYTNQSLKKLIEMNGFGVLSQKNHNYPLKAVDIPKSNYLTEKMHRILVWFIFAISSASETGILQTVICKKIKK